MEKKKQETGSVSQGDESQERPVMTIADVKKNVERDVAVLKAFLTCLQDSDVATAVATHLHGKYMNAKHKEELDRQLEIQP